MTTMLESLRKIFEKVEVDEARHSKTTIDQNGAIAQNNSEEENEPEESFTDYINRKITSLQKTAEELKIAIEREQKSIKNGHIGSINGMEKINGWQNRLNATEFKRQMLQKALEVYTNDQSEDNKRNLKITAMKS